LKQLLPLVRPLHEFVLFLTIPFLDFADKRLVVSSDPLQVIIGELAILLFQFAYELHPFPVELSKFMDSPSRVRWRCFSVRIDLARPPLSPPHPPVWREDRQRSGQDCIYRSKSNHENPSDIALWWWIRSLPSHKRGHIIKNISNTERSTEPSPEDLRIIVAMYVD
jgi:hypothetical protein